MSCQEPAATHESVTTQHPIHWLSDPRAHLTATTWQGDPALSPRDLLALQRRQEQRLTEGPASSWDSAAATGTPEDVQGCGDRWEGAERRQPLGS